jgi:bifunctional isochorismate lyase/aryl carrier protein
MALDYVAGRCGKVLACREVLSLGSGGAFSRESLQARLLSLLDEVDEPFDADANLLDYGLDSIQVMTLLSEWRERGLELTFTDLARTPTLNGWWALIQAQGGAA